MKLKQTDAEIDKLIKKEAKRQRQTLQMIPSENSVSQAVLEAIGSVFVNKYSEGYAGKRYYQGNGFADEVELLAIERAKELFKVPYVNVQPYSGSPANAEVYFAVLTPGDTLMGMALPFGGHLTHGQPDITFSGKYFKTVQYETDKNGFIDYDKLRQLALAHRPKIIISGATAYPRIIDFEKIGNIADEVEALHMADISHIAGLVATGVHPSPVPFAHIVTTTTHKTLRGPRGAMIMVTQKGLAKDPSLGNKIDKAVFPGMQGGPHDNTTAAIAVCLKEAATPEFKHYSEQVVKNSHVLAQKLMGFGFKLSTDGTDNHLLLVNLTNKNINGWCAAWALEYAGIIVNRNTVPFDTRSAFYGSGIRLGTPAITTSGMKEAEMEKVATWLSQVIDEAVLLLPKDIESTDKELAKKARAKFKASASKNKVIKKVRDEVKELCMSSPKQ
jgi:glycine hydroxymethyltransferase